MEGFKVGKKAFRRDLSISSNANRKKHDSSENQKLENVSSLMKKIKAAPKYMIDYRTNLETSMYKKKFGLEKVNEFHKIMNENPYFQYFSNMLIDSDMFKYQ